MTEERSPVDALLDVLLYAPVGIALTVRDELPRLVEKGRSRMTGQVAMAKMMGQFAVAQGQKEAERLVKDTVERLGDRRTASPAPSGAAPREDEPAAEPKGTNAAAGATRPAAALAAGPRPSAEDLAIPGYDSLSASHVVQRLAGLSAEELDAVETYESATRGRRTILNRVAQLRA